MVEEPAPVVEEPAPVVEEPAPVVEQPAPVVEQPAHVAAPVAPPVEPTPRPVEKPVKKKKRAQTAGETPADDVALRRPAPVVPKDRSQVSAPDPAKSKGGFRETLWFVKGKAESEAVDQGEAEEQPPEPVAPDAADLAMKYGDDGSIGAEGAHELSLRTGKTQQMKKIDMPSGEIPGETMDAEEFLSEMNRGRTIMIWVGVFLVLAAIGGVVAYILTSDEPAKPKAKQPPATKTLPKDTPDPTPPPVEEKQPEGKAEDKADPKAEAKAEGKAEAKPDPSAEKADPKKAEPKK